MIIVLKMNNENKDMDGLDEIPPEEPCRSNARSTNTFIIVRRSNAPRDSEATVEM